MNRPWLTHGDPHDQGIHPRANRILTLLALTTSLHALLKKRDSKSALAWVAACMAIPLFGPLTYIVFGINRVATTAHRIYLPKTEKDISEAIDEPAGTDFRPMSLIGENVIGQGLRSCDDIQILENGEELYPAMLKDINSATEKVYCSTYIFQNDQTGDEFVSAFVAAKKRRSIRAHYERAGEERSRTILQRFISTCDTVRGHGISITRGELFENQRKNNHLTHK